MVTRIIAAAIKRKELTFFMMPPARHHHVINQYFETAYPGSVIGVNPIQPDEQGFLGSDGQFYSREEAKLIANTGSHSTQLFSEDLW